MKHQSSNTPKDFIREISLIFHSSLLDYTIRHLLLLNNRLSSRVFFNPRCLTWKIQNFQITMSIKNTLIYIYILIYIFIWCLLSKIYLKLLIIEVILWYGDSRIFLYNLKKQCKLIYIQKVLRRSNRFLTFLIILVFLELHWLMPTFDDGHRQCIMSRLYY